MALDAQWFGQRIKDTIARSELVLRYYQIAILQNCLLLEPSPQDQRSLIFLRIKKEQKEFSQENEMVKVVCLLKHTALANSRTVNLKCSKEVHQDILSSPSMINGVSIAPDQ